MIFIVCGEDKAVALKAVLEGPQNPELYPAQSVRPEGRLLWLIDQACRPPVEFTRDPLASPPAAVHLLQNAII